jgi:predicted sulfurtransferase
MRGKQGRKVMGSIRFRSVIALAILSIAGMGAICANASGLPVQANSDGVRRITPDEVRELLKKGKAVIVDVRGEASYKAGHVKGALLIPAGEIGERAKELPKDKMILTYCS